VIRLAVAVIYVAAGLVPAGAAAAAIWLEPIEGGRP
jgi:hypothetical protein